MLEPGATRSPPPLGFWADQWTLYVKTKGGADYTHYIIICPFNLTHRFLDLSTSQRVLAEPPFKVFRPTHNYVSDKLDMALIILLIILLIKNDFYWCILKFPTSLSNLVGITRLLDFKQIVFICLFLTEQAWSHGGLRTRELGQDPSHVSMGD